MSANACDLRHAVGHVRVLIRYGLGVPAYWQPAGPPSPSSFTFSPVPILNPPSTPSPIPYLTLQCPLAQCIGASPAWAAQSAATAAASQRFSTTTKRPPLTIRAAAVATSPCGGSSPSPFSSTPVPSTLATARPEEEERLARGAPNQRHHVAQVP